MQNIISDTAFLPIRALAEAIESGGVRILKELVITDNPKAVGADGRDALIRAAKSGRAPQLKMWTNTRHALRKEWGTLAPAAEKVEL